MRGSDKQDQIMAALFEVQKAMGKVRMDAEGNYGMYSTITGILDTVRPVLEEHGVLLLQPPSGVNSDGDVSLETIFHHVESGQWVAFDISTGVGKKTPQGVGSGITYLRRYSLLGTLALGTTDDDGANAEADKKKRKPKDYDEQMFAAEADLERLLTENAGAEWMTFEIRQGAARKIDQKDLEGMQGAVKWIEGKAKADADAKAAATAAARAERS